MMGDCTWKKVDGRWLCQAEQCTHWDAGKCKIGKVSLSCDNNDCKWNVVLVPGIYGCLTMDIHLDADGKCIGFDSK